MRIVPSKRLDSIPPYVFATVEKMKQECKDKGMDLIDLGVGDPDFPTQQNIVDCMKKMLDDPENHRYPSFRGEIELREQISRWYKREYNIDLDPDTEVLVLIGSKEGITHMPFAFLNEGDYVLVPDPAYPAYATSTLLAGGIPYPMPLKKENSYLPVLEDIPEDILEKAKILYLNYPNNPTSALADEAFFAKVTEFASKYNIIVCHDFAYSEITFDGVRPVSFLSVPGSREVGVEFHSLSKSFAMTGWRIGFVVGNRRILDSLLKFKSCIDAGAFKAVQYAAVEALSGSANRYSYMMDEYGRRRDIVAGELQRLGWEFEIPRATYYFWVKIPGKFKLNSLEFSEFLLKEKGVVVTPGVGFGKYGEGYVRIAINLPIPKIREAISRLKTL